MDTISYARSDVGQVRDSNEDRFYRDDDHRIYAVADGIGGKPGGEIASQIIVDEIASRAEAFERLIDLTQHRSPSPEAPEFDDQQRDSIFSELSGALQEINDTLYQRGNAGAFREGIGSTVDLVVIGRQSAFILHVGDSRVYLIRDDDIFRVTRDHTYSEHLREHPELLGAQRDPERFSHILTRSMGGRPHVEVDRLFVDLRPGDRLVLCSDGVTDYLSGAEILDFSKEHNGDQLAHRLVDCANDRGGKDNATCLVVDVTGEGAHSFSRTATRPDTFRSVRFLQDIELFSELEFQEMLKILRYLRTRHHSSGEVIICRGDRVDGLYFLMSGTLSVELDGDFVDELGSGDHFGEFGLFGEPMRVADVRCLQDCEILFLSKKNLQRLMHADPVLSNKLLWKLLTRTTELVQRMMKQQQ